MIANGGVDFEHRTLADSSIWIPPDFSVSKGNKIVLERTDTPKNEERTDSAVSGSVYGAGGHSRYRQSCGRCGRNRHRRPGSGLLDVGERIFGNDDQICGSCFVCSLPAKG